MAKYRRAAKYIATLVCIDEPHLILLESKKAKVIAVKIPDGSKEYPFLASALTPKEWERYMRGMVDLRYLFLYATKASIYTFDFGEAKDTSKIMMGPWEESSIPDEWLPERKFFSSDHTEPYNDADHRPGSGLLNRLQNASHSDLDIL